MSQSPKSHKTTTESEGTKNPTLLLSTTALDTTWRFFVPLLAGLFIGLWLDGIWHTAPLITIILIVVGALSAGWLIYKQLKAIH